MIVTKFLFKSNLPIPGPLARSPVERERIIYISPGMYLCAKKDCSSSGEKGKLHRGILSRFSFNNSSRPAVKGAYRATGQDVAQEMEGN